MSNYKKKKVKKFQKEILVSSIFQKNNEKNSLMSDIALEWVILYIASKKWSNQIKALHCTY